MSSSANPPRSFSPASIILGLGLIVFAIGVIFEPKASSLVRVAVFPALALLFFGVFTVCRNQRWLAFHDRFLSEHEADLKSRSRRQMGWLIFFATGLGLYFELVLIRWHSSHLHIFNFFKNVSLISCFLGLGIGYARGNVGRVAMPYFLPALAVQFAFLALIRYTDLQQALTNPSSDRLIMGIGGAGALSRQFLLYGFFAVVFTLNTITFIPLGHLASWFMAREKTLVAYGWNLAGALFGMLLFAGVSMLWMPPGVWLAVGALGIFWLFRRTPTALFHSAVAVMVTFCILWGSGSTTSKDVYSPYQVVSLTLPKHAPPMIEANHFFFQNVFDLSEGENGTWADYYALPYTVKEDPGRVLVVGAGTGNDVASALRHGADSVDAVEIDPAILAYGRHLHPEDPYGDSRVTGIVQDARTHIRQTDQTYDLIVYGLLDSHTSLSNLSSVRLDSFVYTVEAFREARARLDEDGVLALSFCVLSEAQGRKLYLMLEQAFDGQTPLVRDGVFFAGPGVASMARASTTEYSPYTDPAIQAEVSTDDWPFLYMPVRKLPPSYLVLLGMLVVISLGIIRHFNPGQPVRRFFSPVYFFLGCGFMLLETKNITQLGLTIGNTWFVVTIAITGVLVMAFLSNLWVMRTRLMSLGTASALLLLWLVGSYQFNPEWFASLSPLASKLATAGVLSVPFFFSGIIFSRALVSSMKIPIGVALSSNLMGAILGGICEYSSMLLGFKSLYLFAIGFYIAAYVAYRLAARPASEEAPKSARKEPTTAKPKIAVPTT